MKLSTITQRLSNLGGAKWEIHQKAGDLINQGHNIIDLTIGEPDMPTPKGLINAATDAMHCGRTGYSNGQGEHNLRNALAERYAHKSGSNISPDNILCFPGTQTALYAVLMGVAETGDEVLVGDPMYATYEGVIRATGASMIPVPLSPQNDFRINAADIESRITPNSTAILLTSPHNPTGSILTGEDINDLGKLALEHNLWIICDEVYDELIFDGSVHVSPLSYPQFEDRVIVVSSISKSHAAAGFRSGWCVGPQSFVQALLPLSETILFGNQPFIADMTEIAIREGSTVAPQMCQRYAMHAGHLHKCLTQNSNLTVHPPQAGMFAMVNVTATGKNSKDYAEHLLQHGGVAVMPGSSFGQTLDNWVRIALTTDSETFDTACMRIVEHAKQLHLELDTK